MINRWNYDGMGDVMYSDDNQESYKKAAAFFGKDAQGEDWGCGMGWFTKFHCPNFKGIDGSLSTYISEAVDLVDYASETDNILLRWVIEHNFEWKKIVKNAIKSFKKKLCLVIFVPPSDHTHVVAVEREGINDISINKQELLDLFKGFKIREETIKSYSPYGEEFILYVEKI